MEQANVSATDPNHSLVSLNTRESTVEYTLSKFQLNFVFLFSATNSSAGIGRTGCVAAILNGIRQMRMSCLTANKSGTNGGQVTVDVLGIVSNLRLQRGGMVQNSEQYELIHRSLCLYHQRLFPH